MRTREDGETTVPTGERRDSGPWDSALELREWDPEWAELCFKMSTNPWTHSVLPRKFIELVSVSLNAACTNLNPNGTRHHIRAALEAGATREEVLFVLKCGDRPCPFIRAAWPLPSSWKKPKPPALCWLREPTRSRPLLVTR